MGNVLTTLPVASRKRMSVHIPASMFEATDSWGGGRTPPSSSYFHRMRSKYSFGSAILSKCLMTCSTALFSNPAGEAPSGSSFRSVGEPGVSTMTQDEVMFMAGFFNKLTVMAGYIHISNPILYMTYVDSEQPDISYNMPENSKYNSLALFGVKGNLQPFKWWTMKPSITFMLQYAQTSRYTVKNQAQWKFSLDNNFTFTCGKVSGSFWIKATGKTARQQW